MATMMIMAVLSGVPDGILEIARLEADQRTYKYNDETLPQVMPDGRSLWALGYNPAGRLDRTGNPNNENPWRVTGGMDRVKNLQVQRYLWIPPNSQIELWWSTGRVKRNRTTMVYQRPAGRYPEGTIVAERMRHGRRTFEVRIRRKQNGEWIGEQYEYGVKPPGYEGVANCVDCHSDIGRHARALDWNRDWYGTVRGLEKGGPIHWHPFETRAVYQRFGNPQPVRLRADVRHLVRWIGRQQPADGG